MEKKVNVSIINVDRATSYREKIIYHKKSDRYNHFQQQMLSFGSEHREDGLARARPKEATRMMDRGAGRSATNFLRLGWSLIYRERMGAR